MKITIIYDNISSKEGLKADWGFACLVEAYKKTILFDTGADGSILLDNMKTLGLHPGSVNEVFISHNHHDHTGGLSAFLNENSEVVVYAPATIRGILHGRKTVYVDKPIRLSANVFTTGLLGGIEQSLIIKTKKGLVIVVGCAHPGVSNILEAAVHLGNPDMIVGGLHGFKEFELIESLRAVCPTHCTQHISEIQSLYPEKYIPGGVGKVIEI